MDALVEGFSRAGHVSADARRDRLRRVSTRRREEHLRHDVIRRRVHHSGTWSRVEGYARS